MLRVQPQAQPYLLPEQQTQALKSHMAILQHGLDGDHFKAPLAADLLFIPKDSKKHMKYEELDSQVEKDRKKTENMSCNTCLSAL